MSKARKILKRTLVGTSLITVVGLLLWWNSTSPGGQPLFWTAAVVLLATVYEVSRMGSLAHMDFMVPLVGAACVSIAIAWLGFQGHAFASHGWIGSEVAFIYRSAFLVALSGCAFLYALKRITRSSAVARVFTAALVAAVLGFVLFGWDAGTAERAGIAFLVLFGLALVSALIVRDRESGTRIGIATLLSVWIVPPLLLVWTIWAQWGTRGLVALLALSKIGDTCGYYVGSTIGKTHPFPKISPGKTTAGCVGSFAGATVLGGILWVAHVVPDGPFGLWGALAAGATLNIAAQAGDLLKSWTKRRAGVKDSSTIFGPAGGLLDQVDSLLLTVPMACVTWPFLFA